MTHARKARPRLVLAVLFVPIPIAIAAIWLPEVVIAQEWRQQATERALLGLDDRQRTTEGKLTEIATSANGRLSHVEGDVATLLQSQEALRRLVAQLDFLRLEATLFAGAFGAFLWWVVRWVLRSFQELRREISASRRDFLAMAPVLIKLAGDGHLELSGRLQDRLDRRQMQEDETESGSLSLFRAE